MRRVIYSDEPIEHKHKLFLPGSPYREKLQRFTEHASVNPHFKNFEKSDRDIKECEEFSCFSKWHICSTCSYLYLFSKERTTFFIDPGKIIGFTKNGVFTEPKKISHHVLSKDNTKVIEKMNRIIQTTLLYGMSFTHTETVLNAAQHLENQINLLIDSYTLFLKKKIFNAEKMKLVANNQIILYLEISNPIEKAETTKGFKITHPHAWIRTWLPYYGPCLHVNYYDGSVTWNEFITENTTKAFNIHLDNLDKKAYIRFYIDLITKNINRCEIDV